MSISKMEFKNAFREAVALEFEDIPEKESDIDCRFSEMFQDRMEKLVRSQKKMYWKCINMGCKRVAIACAMVLLSLCWIGRPFIDRFAENKQEGTGEYLAQKAKTLVKECSIGELPEGYKFVEKTISKDQIEFIYENPKGDRTEKIYLSEEIGVAYEFAEEGQQEQMIIDDRTVKISENNGKNEAVWMQDGQLFRLSWTEQFDTEIIRKIILSIK